MNAELTIVEIKKLTPQNGDVLVLRCMALDPREMERMVNGLRSQGIDNPLFVIMDDSDMYMLPEAMMAKMGWVRKGE